MTAQDMGKTFTELFEGLTAEQQELVIRTMKQLKEAQEAEQ